jgi:hypothetical protein
MRFLTTLKMREDIGDPPQALVDAVGKHIEDGFREGYLVGAGGLASPSDSRAVRARDGRLQVVDGPFSEAKEVVGGYAFIEARSLDEAVALASRMVQLHLDLWPGWEGESEVRQVFGPDAESPAGA